MTYHRNIEIISKHNFMITKKICILLCFQSFLCTKQFFLTKVFFFKDIPQCFNFQGLFKDMVPFHGLFKAHVNHALGNCKLRTEFASLMAKSTSPRLSDRAFFAHCSPWYHNVWLSRPLSITILNSCAGVSIIFEVSSGFGMTNQLTVSQSPRF